MRIFGIVLRNMYIGEKEELSAEMSVLKKTNRYK